VRDSKRIISIAILMVLILHVVPIYQELKGPRQTVWPIMAWGMYRYSYPDDHPVRTTRRRIVAVSAAGERIEVEPGDVGLMTSAFNRFYSRGFSRGDSTAMQSAAQRLADHMNADREDPIVRLRLEGETYTVTPNGLVITAEPVAVFRVTE
jgi:hypothetical protein